MTSGNDGFDQSIQNFPSSISSLHSVISALCGDFSIDVNFNGGCCGMLIVLGLIIFP